MEAPILIKKCSLKILTLLIALIPLSRNLNAQTWFPDGAVWHTGIIDTYFSVAQGYSATTVIADTIILSESCKLLQSVYYDPNGLIRNIDTAYMYSDSGIVYHYREGQFYSLYNFNASVGDFWKVSVPYPSIFASGNPPDTIVNIYVDSTAFTTINGISRKVLYVHSIANDWEFRNPIIEGIGSMGGLYPFIFGWLDQYIPYLRCYSDSLLYFESHIFNVQCDDLINDVSENPTQELLTIFPNPVSEFVTIQSDYLGLENLNNVRIYNLYGAEMSCQRTMIQKNLISFDLKNFPEGIYVMSGNHFNKKIIVSRIKDQ